MNKKYLALALAVTMLFISGCGEKEITEVQELSAVQEDAIPVPIETESETETESEEVDISDALVEEGLDYFYARNGQEVDYEKALEIFQEAAEADNARAWYYVGKIYDTDTYHDTQDKGYSKSTEAYEKSFELGYPLACAALGDVYKNGNGIMPDYEKARQYYEDAIASDCVEANLGLADLYYNGFGVEADVEKAKELCLLATNGSEAGCVVKVYDELAKYEEYGDSYVNGVVFDYQNEDGRAVDFEKVIEYLSKAEELCTWNADYTAWLQGAYTSAGNTEKAEECKNSFTAWCEEAKNSENERYLCDAAQVLCSDRYVEKDEARSFDFYLQAAELGDPFAMNEVGWYYKEPIGVDADYTLAMEWYEKAAAAGSANAINNIGYMYTNELGVERNGEREVAQYQKAFELGNAVSANQLGWLYQCGDVVEQDYAKAKEYYQQAADRGFTPALNNLASLYKNGLGVEQDYEKAFQCYQIAAAYGTVEAYRALGNCYYLGNGVDEDKNQALASWKKL